MDQQKCINGLPQRSGEYKVVQMCVDGRPEIYFGDLHKTLHCTILGEALEQYAIPIRYITVQDDISVPATEGERYRVVGMGKALVNVERKFVQFYGNSFHYGLGIEREYLAELMRANEEWSCIVG